MPTFTTPSPITVRTEVVLGDVRITSSDRTDTVVEVRPANAAKHADVQAAEDVRIELVGDRLLVKTLKSWKHYTPFGTDGSVDVTIDVPTGSSLDGDSAMGDVRVEGEVGECRLRTGMGSLRVDHAATLALKTGFGDLTVDRATGDADLVTGSGQVRAGTIDGAATIRNSNGATRLGTVRGDLRVKAANGAITVDRADSSVVAKTVCGNVRIGEIASGTVVIETAAGELEVGIREGTAAWLDLRSGYGDVRNSLDAGAGPSASEQTVEVRARTSAGDIVVFRASPAPATPDAATERTTA